MLVTEKIQIKGNSRNLKHYKDLNYDIKHNKNIMVNVCDLPKTTKYKIIAKCDICGIEKEISYHSYLRNIKKYNIYTCISCCDIKNKKTNNEKYNVNYPTQSKEIILKRKQNNLDKYGVDETVKLQSNKDKVKQTKLKKYGNRNYNNIEKIKKTKLKKYGNENYNNREKAEKSCLLKYGVTNISKVNTIKNKKKLTYIKNYNVDNYSKSDNYKQHNNNFLLNKYKELNIRKIYGDTLTFYCDKCKKEYEINKFILRNRITDNTIICTNCNPIYSHSKSGKEIQLLNFIKENYNGEIISNDRTILKPFELDIYLPQLKLAFEFNGLYWHNELNKPKNYHLDKTEKCLEQGIKLIHIWEDDWNYKQEIIKSIILNYLNKNKETININECKIMEIFDNELVMNFLNNNHIESYLLSDINLGLFHNNELISLMTFKKHKNKFELLRFCNKNFINISNAEVKLFNYFIENHKAKEILTYIDRSYSTENLFESIGFKLKNKISPSANYIFNDIRIDENFTNKKLYKIFNAGKLKYSYFELDDYNI
ncbi:hypothetical protein M0Q97_08050 [Candidatus Dojkabacteria bacterium]|nr:hypothetical protein [Candidatus Dojkabacteria bacterium]